MSTPVHRAYLNLLLQTTGVRENEKGKEIEEPR